MLYLLLGVIIKKKIKMDKGQAAQFALLVERVNNGGDSLIPFDSIVNTTRTSFAAIQSLKEKRWIDIQ